MEYLEALEQYTVVQLILATPVLYIVYLIVRQIGSVTRKSTSGELATVLQTLGGVIANELKGVVDDARQDRAAFMQSFAAQSREHTGITDALKNIADILTGHNTKVDANHIAINQLSTDQQATNTQVTNMNGDIIEIKQLLKTALQAIDTMSKNLLLILEKLEEETEAETEESKPQKPEAPGVPVTPKPETLTVEAPKVEDKPQQNKDVS
jgi:hypothetical protein